MNLKELFSKQIAVYGVGRGNAPALMLSAGHLWAVSYFLNQHYDTHLKRSLRCDTCPLV